MQTKTWSSYEELRHLFTTTYQTNQNNKVMENLNSKIFLILFQFFIHYVLSSIAEKEVDICHINDISCIAENKIIYLPPIHVGWSEENENISQMFFIESSGRDHLLPRQACAVESALRNSNIPKIIVGKYFLCLESDLFSM